MGVLGTGRLVDLDDAVARDIRDGLTDTARPSNFDGPSNRVRAQTEVRALVVGGEVTASRRDCPILRTTGGDDFDFCANRITVALMPDK